MLNNLTNLFNLIKSRMVKTVLENDDLIVVGTKDGKYNGGYKPTIIKFSNLAAQLNAGEVESVTDDGNGIVSVDNTDTANPIIEFNGVNTDGITITGDGSSGSPLVATIIPNTNFGLFSQTGNSAPITGTTVETTLINGGVGTLTVPANSFVVGDSFRAVFGGVLNAANNQTIRVKVKAGSVVLLDSGLQAISNITNDIFELNIDFTIRQLGVAGVASIVALGGFHYTKTSNGSVQGFAFNTINNTTFDTTVTNTLDVTVQWGSTSGTNSIYSDIFILNKTY
jgi:hypothetical protein